MLTTCLVEATSWWVSAPCSTRDLKEHKFLRDCLTSQLRYKLLSETLFPSLLSVIPYRSYGAQTLIYLYSEENVDRNIIHVSNITVVLKRKTVKLAKL